MKIIVNESQYKKLILKKDINESNGISTTRTRDIENTKDFTKDLNEKQKGYLDKVVEQLLRETKINYEKGWITYPFFGYETDKIEWDSTGGPKTYVEPVTYPFKYRLKSFRKPFFKYLTDIFPLSKEEITYAYEMYVDILNSKIRKYYVDNDIYNKHHNVMGTKTINS